MSITLSNNQVRSRDPQSWVLRPTLSARSLVLLLGVCALLAVSAHRTSIDRLIVLSMDALSAGVGFHAESQVGEGFGRIVRGMFPLQFAETTELARIEDFDRSDLPWGTRIETRTMSATTIDPTTLQTTTTSRQVDVLVEPFGYVLRVGRLMLETIEIALWGTLLALLVAIPCCALAATNYTPHRWVYLAMRGISGILRAIPELISALLLVLVFGFGPAAGVLALGLHTAGFLCKFFAEDIENADRAPQDALRAAGANKLKVLRFAVLPNVLPSYLAYTQYILERNIRSATVIGIVGAGGIGQELKGRFEMFDFAHVGTILVAILITVLALELFTGRLRQRFI